MGAHPTFYLGLILFAVGALIACFVFFGTLVVARAERTYRNSVPLVTFGAITAAIIAVFTIAAGAIILIPTFLWSVGLVRHIDSLMYKHDLVGLRHSSQQVNVAAHVSVWYAIAAIVFGAKPMSEGESQRLPALHLLPPARERAPLLTDPGPHLQLEDLQHSYAMYLAVLASMVHGLTVPGAIEVAQRRRLHAGPVRVAAQGAGQPCFSAMFISLIGFGFLGGISGVMMGTEQLNLIIHNTIYVPGISTPR